MCVVQETRNGVVLTLGSYGERCECDNSTSGACPVGTDLKLVCGGRLKTQITHPYFACDEKIVLLFTDSLLDLIHSYITTEQGYNVHSYVNVV